jgi:carboxymethylenebutenolidase
MFDDADEFETRPTLTGVTPGTAHATKFLVTTEPIAYGSIGRAVLTGLAAVKVYVNNAGHGYAALAMPIFARTAPDFDVGYDAAGLEEGRRHRDQLTAGQFLDDARAAIAWLQAQPGLERRSVGCVGFCFGGHLSLLAATLPEVAATCDFYGARVSTDRPGGGSPTLAVVPQISGTLLCFCGDKDPLMPPEELAAIQAALAANGQPPLSVAAGAGHGFMCEARADFHPAAAAEGWHQMLALFAERFS